MTATDFIIDRVEELATLRRVSQAELFEGLSDFFIGSASLWYRAVKRKGKFVNWGQVNGDCMWEYLRSSL